MRRRCQNVVDWANIVKYRQRKDGIIEEHQEVELRRLLGDELAEKALWFAKSQSIDAVLDKLGESLRERGNWGAEAPRQIMETHGALAANLDID